jgi:hypothetical protein
MAILCAIAETRSRKREEEIAAPSSGALAEGSLVHLATGLEDGRRTQEKIAVRSSFPHPLLYSAVIDHGMRHGMHQNARSFGS